jgi:hypothetical protein
MALHHPRATVLWLYAWSYCPDLLFPRDRRPCYWIGDAPRCL